MRTFAVGSTLILVLLCGCQIVPTIEIRVLDHDGQPVPDLPVEFSSTGNVEFRAELLDGRTRSHEDRKSLTPTQSIRGRRFSVPSNADGEVLVHFSPPERSGFWSRLIGASTPDGEVRIRYTLPSGVTVEQTQTAYTR